jgi:hypothetical protein
MSKTLQAVILGCVVALVVSTAGGLLLGMVGDTKPFGGVTAGVGVGILSAFVFANLSGNRRIANASDADKAAVLSRQPPPGKALLFLYREGYVAKLAGMNLTVDDKPVAQLKAPRFTCIVVPAGHHVIAARFGGMVSAQSLLGQCALDVAADSAAAVRIGVRMTFGRNGVDLQPQADLAAAKARLAGMPMTPPDLAEL